MTDLDIHNHPEVQAAIKLNLREYHMLIEQGNTEEYRRRNADNGIWKRRYEEAKKQVREKFGKEPSNAAPQCFNTYDCPCGETWDLESDSRHDDRCPKCGKACSPSESVKV